MMLNVTAACRFAHTVLPVMIDQRLMPTEEARRAWAEAKVPVGAIGKPRDLAVLVAFLCLPLARPFAGQVIHVDGGARRFSH
jgi:3-oxoacyl-[acyl-carrier protein] reductase